MQDAQLSPMSSCHLQAQTHLSPTHSQLPDPVLRDAQTSAVSFAASAPSMQDAQLSPMASAQPRPDMVDAHTSAVSFPRAGPELQDAQLSPMSSRLSQPPGGELHSESEHAEAAADASTQTLAIPAELDCQDQLDPQAEPAERHEGCPDAQAAAQHLQLAEQPAMPAARLGPVEAADEATQTSVPVPEPPAAGRFLIGRLGFTGQHATDCSLLVHMAIVRSSLSSSTVSAEGPLGVDLSAQDICEPLLLQGQSHSSLLLPCKIRNMLKV